MMAFDDRRDTGRDPLAGQTSEDAQGAAPRVLASPGPDSAVWEPQADVLETGRVASHPGPTEGASRIAEQPYPDEPLASRKAP